MPLDPAPLLPPGRANASTPSNQALPRVSLQPIRHPANRALAHSCICNMSRKGCSCLLQAPPPTNSA